MQKLLFCVAVLKMGGGESLAFPLMFACRRAHSNGSRNMISHHYRGAKSVPIPPVDGSLSEVTKAWRTSKVDPPWGLNGRSGRQNRNSIGKRLLFCTIYENIIIIHEMVAASQW